MRGTIRELKATETIIPKINIEVELANDRDESVQILGYSMKLFLCNVPVGDVSRFDIMHLDLQRTERVQEDFIINPYIFKIIENQRNGGDVPVNIQTKCLGIMDFKSEERSLVRDNFREVHVNFDHSFKLSQSRLPQI